MIKKQKTKRIFLTIIFTIIIAILAFTIGTSADPERDNSLSRYKAGAMYSDKLNPVFWLPAPIFTPTHTYSLGVAVVPSAMLGSLLSVIITIPYWIFLAYLISCLIVREKNEDEFK